MKSVKDYAGILIELLVCELGLITLLIMYITQTAKQFTVQLDSNSGWVWQFVNVVVIPSIVIFALAYGIYKMHKTILKIRGEYYELVENQFIALERRGRENPNPLGWG